MATRRPTTPVRWTLCPHRFRWVCETSGQAAADRPVAAAPKLELLFDRLTALAVVDAAESVVPQAAGTWRGLVLAHPGGVLPAGVLGTVCQAMEASGVLLALASLPDQTLLLVPAPLLGRALAALHQAGITHAAPRPVE